MDLVKIDSVFSKVTKVGSMRNLHVPNLVDLIDFLILIVQEEVKPKVMKMLENDSVALRLVNAVVVRIIFPPVMKVV